MSGLATDAELAVAATEGSDADADASQSDEAKGAEGARAKGAESADNTAVETGTERSGAVQPDHRPSIEMALRHFMGVDSGSLDDIVQCVAEAALGADDMQQLDISTGLTVAFKKLWDTLPVWMRHGEQDLKRRWLGTSVVAVIKELKASAANEAFVFQAELCAGSIVDTPQRAAAEALYALVRSNMWGASRRKRRRLSPTRGHVFLESSCTSSRWISFVRRYWLRSTSTLCRGLCKDHHNSHLRRPFAPMSSRPKKLELLRLRCSAKSYPATWMRLPQRCSESSMHFECITCSCSRYRIGRDKNEVDAG